MSPDNTTPRRTVLLTGVLGAGAAALTACAGAQQGPAQQGPNTPAPPKPPANTRLTSLAGVPVGGAVSATGPGGQPAVVSQPKQGEVAAFSAVCTHQGCTVKPDGSKLRCPCHGSVFESATGAVVNGPAPRPLDRIAVRVEGGNVVTT